MSPVLQFVKHEEISIPSKILLNELTFNPRVVDGTVYDARSTVYDATSAEDSTVYSAGTGFAADNSVGTKEVVDSEAGTGFAADNSVGTKEVVDSEAGTDGVTDVRDKYGRTPDELLKKIKDSLTNLIFGRTLSINPQSTIFYKKFTDNIHFTYIYEDEYNKLTDIEKEKYVIQECDKFTGKLITYDKQVYEFNSKNYCELDFISENPTFWFNLRSASQNRHSFGSGPEYKSILPRTSRLITENNKTKKYLSDLICGIFKPGSNSAANNTSELMFWFICSEQFHRFYKIIMFNNNHPHMKNFSTIKDICQGCKINTATGLKWLNYISDEVYKLKNTNLNLCTLLTSNFKDIVNLIENYKDNHFWIQRTEYTSLVYIHVYTALLLFCIHKTLPTKDNIPQNLDGSCPQSKWSIPKNWIL